MGRDGAAHGGVAGRGGARQDGMPTGRVAEDTSDPLAPRGPRTTVLNVLFEAQPDNFLCKPMEEQNPQLASG